MMMRRRTFVATAAAAGLSLAAPARSFAQADASAVTSLTETTPRTGYAPANGLEMYYEIHGEGETPPSSGGELGRVPLVLLHGAFGAIDLWGPILTTLAEQHQVIAVEFQGHGHTADIDRPLGYEQLADDVAALMNHLTIGQADIVGYSMGATTGLQLAIRHPNLVRKLVAISANYRSDGYYPELLAGLQVMTPAIFAGTPHEEAYLRHAPNPEDFLVLVEKQKVLPQEFAFPEEDVRSITAPALVVVGDSDVVRPDHAVALFRLLGGGVPGDLTGLPSSQLAILPGATHGTIVLEPTSQLLAMIEAFLASPMPEVE
jgi:pimeloyl-ACP methyl ester carboxylesterase